MNKESIVKRFIQTSAIYFFGKIATYIVSFLMLKYYTDNIKPEDYGEYEYLCSLYNVIVPVLFIEIWSGLLRFTINKSNKEKETAISTVLLLSLPMLFIYSIIYFIISYYVKIDYAIQMYSISALFYFLNILMMTSRAFELNKLFVLSGIIGACVNALLSFILISYYSLSVEALLYALIANYVVQIIFLVYATRILQYFKISSFDTLIAKSIILFCLPFSINTILYYINTNYYKVVVNNYLGSDVLGLFSVSTKFCMIVTFVVSVFHLAWQEITYSQTDKSDRELLYGKGLRLIYDGVILSTLAIIPFLKIVSPIFIGDMYIDSLEYIPYYYITIFFTSVSGFYYNTLAAENITVYHPIAKFFAAGANLAVIYSLIDFYDIYAIIIGAIICSVVEWAVLLIVARKKLNLSQNITPTLLFLIIYLIGGIVFKLSYMYNLLYLILLIIVGGFYFYYSNKDLVMSFLKK